MASYTFNQIIPLPKTVANLTLWLDAADTSTITLSGTAVTAVADKSPIKNNYVQTNAGNRPTYQVDPVYGKPGFLFTRASGTNLTPANNTLRSLNGSSWTIFFVCRFSDPNEGSVQTIWRGQLIGYWTRFFIPGNVSFYVPGSDVQFGRTFANASGIWGATTSTSAQTVYLNGTQTGTGGRGNVSMSDYFTIGGHGTGEGMTGYIFEFLVYNTNALSTTDRQSIEGYLAWKWGLQASLPSNHPYARLNPGAPIYPLLYTLPTNTKETNVFTPTQISNCVLWMDAADTSSASMSFAGTTVATWRSKANTNSLASLGRILNPGTIGAGKLPTISVSYNAQPVFANVLGFGGNTAQTTVMLGMVPFNANSAVLGMIRYLTAGGGNAFGLSLGSDIRYNSFSTYQNQGGANVTITTTTRAQMGISIQNGTTQFSFESGTAGSTATYTLNQIDGRPRISYFGTGTTANCEIAEVIIFSKALSTAERQQVEGYLAWKWGLVANLPANHPYKNNPIGSPIARFSLPQLVLTAKWQPTQVSNCILWLDGKDVTKVGVSGANVTAWNDKSGLNNNLTTISSIPPKYSKATGAITFSATNQTSIRGALNTTYTNPMSTFIVCAVRLDATAIYNPRLITFGTNGTTATYFAGQFVIVPFSSSGSTPAFCTYANNNQNPTGQGGNIQTYIPTSFLRVGIFENISNYSGTTLTLNTFLDGSTSANSSRTTSWTVAAPYVTSMAYVSLGANTNGSTYLGDDFSGDIYEVLAFSRNVSTVERQQIEGYLAWKWKLVANLPSTHPYKLFPPSP